MKFNNIDIAIGKNVKIGKDVKIGDHSIIYDNVTILDNTIIANNCVIGEPLHTYYNDENYKNPETVIGTDSLIRSHSIIYAGCKIRGNLQTGHHITIREHTIIGEHCSIGSYNDLQGFLEIGNYCRFHSYVNIGQKSVIKDYVFIYPFTVLTNDPKPPSNDIIGPFIDSYTQIASSSVILPGVRLGQHCLVGAGSLVNADFEDYAFINGNPAKKITDVRKLPLFSESKRHYPWPYNFKRGMPWEELGFENWQKSKKK